MPGEKRSFAGRRNAQNQLERTHPTDVVWLCRAARERRKTHTSRITKYILRHEPNPRFTTDI